MTKLWRVVTVLAACGGDEGTPADAPSNEDAPPRPATVVYLNRGGGTFTEGTDNSSGNVSAVVQGSVTLPAPTIDEADWTAVRTCVDEKFAPFNVTITEADPGLPAHTEVVVADDLDALDFGGQNIEILGLSPTPTCNGSFGNLIQRAVVYASWAGHSNGFRCQIIAQIVGTSFGLDHTTECTDLMYFGSSMCGDEGLKTFTNQDVPCGEFTARTCQCGLETQNAFSHLVLRVGAK